MMRTFNDCYVIIVFNAATVYFSLYARPFKLFLLYFLIITLTSFMCCTYTNIYIACDCVMCIRACFLKTYVHQVISTLLCVQ